MSMHQAMFIVQLRTFTSSPILYLRFHGLLDPSNLSNRSVVPSMPRCREIAKFHPIYLANLTELGRITPLGLQESIEGGCCDPVDISLSGYSPLLTWNSCWRRRGRFGTRNWSDV